MNIIRLISKLTSASFREKANSSSSFLQFNLFQNSEIYNFNFKYTLLSSCRCAGSTLKRSTIFTVGVLIATGDQNENFDGYSSETWTMLSDFSRNTWILLLTVAMANYNKTR